MASAAAAGISAGASILSGITGSKGAKKAADVQAAAYQKGIDEQHNEFATTQANFAPYLQGGGKALASVLDLLGLNGGTAQGSSIDALKASPGFTSLYNTGSDTILQNASATGGLRGGNTQSSLANFGSSLLSTVIQGQLSNLGGLVNVGSGAAGSLGTLGQQNASAVSTLLGQQGSAQSTGILGQTAAMTGMINSLGSIGSNVATSKGW